MPLPRRVQLIVDKDIGTNRDDFLALAYLLRERNCDPYAIMTVTGQPERRTDLAAEMRSEDGVFKGWPRSSPDPFGYSNVSVDLDCAGFADRCFSGQPAWSPDNV